MDRTPKKNQRSPELKSLAPWQHRLHEIIFEADTREGKLFDVALFALIALSIILVMTESVLNSPPKQFCKSCGHAISIGSESSPDRAVELATPQKTGLNTWLVSAEIVLTLLFTIEYVLRILCVGKPLNYVFSFFGIVDLFSILPTYIAIAMWRGSGSTYAEATAALGSLTIVRALRLLRVFRVLKLAQYLSEANLMLHSLRRTAAKIIVFLLFVMVVCLILGTTVYVVEGGPQGTGDFQDIPSSVYWAIVTVTTVGYGDMAPSTWLGQSLAAMAMIIGYSIIVVPTGIVTAEMMAVHSGSVSTRACHECSRDGHALDADYCKFCGYEL